MSAAAPLTYDERIAKQMRRIAKFEGNPDAKDFVDKLKEDLAILIDAGPESGNILARLEKVRKKKNKTAGMQSRAEPLWLKALNYKCLCVVKRIELFQGDKEAAAKSLEIPLWKLELYEERYNGRKAAEATAKEAKKIIEARAIEARAIEARAIEARAIEARAIEARAIEARACCDESASHQKRQ